MRLYTQGELAEIKANLVAGRNKFNVGIYKCFFSGHNNYVIQRISNKFLGLAYVKEADSLFYNYPHLSNIKKSEISSISNASFSKKLNGTNIRIGRMGPELWHGTRGTLNPSKFLNDINTAIIQNKSGIIGVSPEVFTPFRLRYEPVLKSEIEKGLVDAYGNFVLKPEIVNHIKAVLAPVFESKSVVAVFGELISAFNPICVSPDLSAGIYIEDADHDYQYIVFDVLSQTDEGDVEFWDPMILDQLPLPKVTTFP